MMKTVPVVEEMELMIEEGIIHADPMDAEKLNKLVRKVSDEIIKVVMIEHKKYFPDSKMRHDPVVISVNAYSLAMNFVVALNKQVIGQCLDMQANYNQTMKEEDHGNS